MLELRAGCEDGDRRACVRLGILIGENRERRADWRREHPDVEGHFYQAVIADAKLRQQATNR